VVLAFLGYLLVRLAVGSQGHAVLAATRGDFVVAVLLVATVRLGLAYARLKWRSPGSRTARLFPASSLLLLPLAYVVACDVRAWDAGEMQTAGGRMGNALFSTFYLVRRELLQAVPVLFAWLAVGVHLKRWGRLRVKALVSDELFAALDVARDFLPVAVLVFCYPVMADVLRLRSIDDKDWLIAQVDRLLFFGRDPVVLLEALVWTPLSEWLAFCYTAYVLWFPLCLGLLFARRDRAGFRELCFALSLGLAAGYLLYTLVPVQGPLFTQQFSVGLDFYYANWAKDGLMDRYRIARDCFPSLHTALTAIFLWSAWRHLRVLFWCMLPIAAPIPFACVYLRYHYVTDVLAGFILAAAVALVAPGVMARYERRRARDRPTATAATTP
jgi:membrane-associated phospholipid phosphatase